jgi:chemotaxis protein MotB
VLCVILAMLLVLLVSQLHKEPPVAPASAALPESAAAEPAPGRAAVDPQRSPLPVHPPLPASLPPPPESPALRPIAPAAPTPAPVPKPVPAGLLELADGGVKVIRDPEGMTLQIAEVVLFDSSEASLKESAAPVLERAFMLLREFDELGEADVAVQGHTDDKPVQSGPYQSNWELAAARANAVAAVLLASGFPPERLRLESYADTRPIANNATDAGRARNRRVELRLELPPMEYATTNGPAGRGPPSEREGS